MIQLELILRQISEALACFDRLNKEASGQLHSLADHDLFELHTTLAAAVESLAPPDSVYRRQADAALERSGLYNQAASLAGVLRALYGAYLGGYFSSFSQLVRADLFDDFLEMAEHLLEQGYKDAAAVITGGVLEEHLRKLCERQAVDILVGDKPKPASKMNDELAAKGAYAKLDVKSVTAWLGVRNSAAHGRYGDYEEEQVRLMILGVREFAARTITRTAG